MIKIATLRASTPSSKKNDVKESDIRYDGFSLVPGIVHFLENTMGFKKPALQSVVFFSISQKMINGQQGG
ncbi:MAG: hypothetical protein FP816_02835 [Desulfobacteraceae bacterium]|nr:hypothetical protein [Desulfobacteraceae bacterium]MBU4055114.1 hypothetical protein [Pseudomonadota bacterium]